MEHRTFASRVESYLIGFACSLVLTGTSFLVVMSGGLGSSTTTMVFIGSLAIIQLFVQLRFFLHLKFDTLPFSRAGALWLTIGTMLVIVIGSIWIMKNLDYRMGMTPEAMEEYMKTQNRKGF